MEDFLCRLLPSLIALLQNNVKVRRLDRQLIADGSIPEYSEHTTQVGLNIFVLAGDLLQRHCVHPIYSAQHLLRQVTREARASSNVQSVKSLSFLVRITVILYRPSVVL